MLCGCCDASLPRRGGSFSTAHPADGKHSGLLHPSIRIASDSSSGDFPGARLLRPRFPRAHLSSALSYLPEEQRPAALRGPRLDSFFSDLLLPHEVAHQWWGNIVTAGDYRTAWLIESLAEDSALQYLQSMKGPQ